MMEGSLVISILIGVWASSWNRSGFGWFLISLLITPLFAAILLLILGEYVR